MNNIILAALLAVLTIGFCGLAWADRPAVLDAVMATERIQSGMVRSVSFADVEKGTTSAIALAVGTAGTAEFIVTANTTLYDASMKAIALHQIQAGSTVAIAYTVSPEGVKEAKSVKVL